MKLRFCSTVALGASLLAASSVLGVTTTTHLYHLGETDAGAVAGNVGNATTIDSADAINLTRNGSPTYSSDTGAAGSTLSVDFNGASGNYQSGNISSLQNNFGIEVWVKSDSTTGNRTIAYNGNSGGTGWGLYQIGGNYQALFGGLTIFGGGAIVPGQWTHLALVRDGGTSTVFINGLAAGATSGTTPNVPSTGFFVGGNSGGAAEVFDGKIDEVRSFAFTAGQFNRFTDLNFNANSNVLAHYRLGDSDPGAIAGNTGNAVTIDDKGLRNLNRNGTPAYTNNTPGFATQLAMDFSGVDGQGYIAGPVVTTAQNNFILEGWFNADSTSGVDVVANNGNTGTSGFGLIRNGNEWQGLFGGIIVMDFNAPVTVDEWTHLALVRENGLTRLFVNGLQIGGTFGNTPNLPSGVFSIGSNHLGTESFDGQIDEVRLSTFTGGFTVRMLNLDQSIPEPGTASLLLLTAAGAMSRRRRVA